MLCLLQQAGYVVLKLPCEMFFVLSVVSFSLCCVVNRARCVAHLC